jgi:hypothetical protein
MDQEIGEVEDTGGAATDAQLNALLGSTAQPLLGGPPPPPPTSSYRRYNNHDGTGWHLYNSDSVVAADAMWMRVERGRGGAVTKEYLASYIDQQVTVSFIGNKDDITGKLLKVSSKTLSLELEDGTVVNPRLPKIAEVHPVDDNDNVDGEAAEETKVVAAAEEEIEDAEVLEDDDAAGTGLSAVDEDDDIAAEPSAADAELEAKVAAKVAADAALLSENAELKSKIAAKDTLIAELQAKIVALPDLWDSQTSAERKKYIKDNGFYLNQNTVSAADMRAYQVRRLSPRRDCTLSALS